MTLSIRDLEYLIAISETQSFSKAAEKCFVSQPTLSFQLKKLEDFYDIKIFERHHKKVIITSTGIELLNKAKEILSKCQQFDELAKSIKAPLAGNITIALIPTIGPYLLPHILPKLNKNFPDLTCYFRVEKTQQCLELLHSGKIDAAILALPLPKNNTNSQIKDIKLYFEQFYLACNKNHQLIKNNIKNIDNDCIKEQKLMLLEEGHCLRDQSIDICNLVDNNNKLISQFQATCLESLRAIIATDPSHASIMPKYACNTYPNIKYIPINENKVGRNIHICFRASDPRTKLMQSLSDYIISIERSINNMFPK